MSDPQIDGVIRKLWIDRAGPYRDHLLRLDADSRRNRFGGAVSDEFIHKYIALPIGLDAVIHGYFVDGVLRGVAALSGLAMGGSLTSVTVTVTVELEVFGSATPFDVPLSVIV